MVQISGFKNPKAFNAFRLKYYTCFLLHCIINQKASAKWQLHGSWHELLDSIIFLLLQTGHHLLIDDAHHANVEIPHDGTLFHLFKSAKYVYDAHLSIVKFKMKGGSDHICKTVYDSIFGSIFVKGVEELHALQNILWDETKLQPTLSDL